MPAPKSLRRGHKNATPAKAAILAVGRVVSEAAISGTAGHLNGIKNGAAAGALAIFTDGNPNDAASSYTALVQWGDGNTSTAPGDGSVTISASAGNILVTGGHVYALAGGSQIPSRSPTRTTTALPLSVQRLWVTSTPATWHG